MPELPELAVYAENLRSCVVAKPIEAAEIHHPSALEKITAQEFAGKMKDCIIKDVVRRGKTLGFSLDSGDRIDVHLMMTGEMYFAESRVPMPCVTLKFGNGRDVVFSDSHYRTKPPREPKLRIGINYIENLGLDPMNSAFTLDV